MAGGARDGCKPQFVKVLLPTSLEKLLIPPAFNKHIIREKLYKATILSPLGNSWLLHVQKESQYYYFKKGWREFVEAHDLAVGYFLNFCYHGDRVFGFSAYDLSGCRIEYISTDWESCPKLKKPRVVEKGIRAGNVSKSVTICRHKKDGSLQEPKQENEDACQTRRPCSFQKVIKSYHLTCGQMDIPQKFIKLAGLLGRSSIMLKNDKGTVSTVNLGRTSWGGGRMGKGWGKFARRNRLKVGDECVFELESEGKSTATVKLIPPDFNKHIVQEKLNRATILRS